MISAPRHDTDAANIGRHLNETLLVRTGSAVEELSVAIRDGCRVLSGRVSRYYVKQIAQVVARELDPHVRWENRIAVFSGCGERDIRE